MKKRQLLLSYLSLCSTAGFAIEDNHPNIVLIMTDQQSYNTISALADCNPESYSQTPNIDKLVRNGISFTRTYVANPVSVPSRFCLFSGRYGGEYKVRENKAEEADGTIIRNMLKTYGMGNIFKRGGYETFYAGKVHLPFSGNSRSSKFAHPISYGFDNYLTRDEREELGNETAKFIRNRTSETPFLLVASFLNPHDICLESSTNISEDVDASKAEVAAVINEVRREIANYNQENFYDNMVPSLPFNYNFTTEFPLEFSRSFHEEFPEWYWKKYRWIYAWLVKRVDNYIGTLIDAIDESSLKENTIIVFTSDHGEMQGAHRSVTKSLPYEECQRVPFIVCGKNIVKGKRDHSLICNGIDLIPTLCELANIESPDGLEGISVAKRALGLGEVPQRNLLYTEGKNFTCIHDSDNFKYTELLVKVTKDNYRKEDVLIYLKEDNGEMENVKSIYPEKTQQLKNILKQRRETGNLPVSSIQVKKVIYKPHITNTLNAIHIENIIGKNKIEILSLTGAILYQTTSSEAITIPWKYKGLYLVQVTNESKMYNQKILF